MAEELGAHIECALSYLQDRVSLDRHTEEVVRRALEPAEGRRTVSAFARSLYTSQRALTRRLASAGLPSPSRLLRLGRILQAFQIMGAGTTPLSKVAWRLGYPDQSTFSNQVALATGLRPSRLRGRSIEEWLDAWWDRSRRVEP